MVTNVEQQMAAFALFGELRNKNKDVFEIINLFVKDLLISRQLVTFNITQLRNELEHEYGLELPDAVLETGLKRLKGSITKSHGQYSVITMQKLESEISVTTEERNVNRDVLDSLFLFANGKQSQELDCSERELLKKELFSYLLKNECSNQIILNYLISLDYEAKSRLELVKEGIIIHEALKYNTVDFRSSKHIAKDITIILDMDMLFNCVGYNGALYKTLFEDFEKLVKEINRQNDAQIKLTYFKNTIERVELYFKTAESILINGSTGGVFKPAMQEILNGCATAADIDTKRAKFNYALQSRNIKQLEDYNYFSEENNKYNAISSALINRLKKDMKDDVVATTDKIELAAETLNRIAILRKGNSSKGFFNAEFFFMSGSHIIQQIGSDDDLCKNGNVPLSTQLNFVTSVLWLKLDKGFVSEHVTAFDVSSGARIELAKMLENNIASKYSEAITRFKKGELSDNEVAEAIVMFRQNSHLPEDITKDTLPEINVCLSERNLEDALRRLSQEKADAEKTKEQKDYLARVNAEKAAEIENAQLEIDRINKENAQINERLTEYKHQEDLQNKKRKKRKRRIISGLVILVGFALLFIGLFVLDVAVINTIAQILGIIIALAGFFGITWETIENKIRALRQ